MQKFILRGSIKIISTIILIALFWGKSALASGNYELAAEWGGFGSEDGQFNEPSGIAVDGEDNIYVADHKNCRIQKFTSEGEFITKWGSCGSGTEDFFNPTDVAIDRNGNVYVLNYYALVVQRFCNIQKFTSEGEFITKWGSAGSGDGQFLFPAGIGTDSEGNVFVADWDMDVETYFTTNRIQKFTSEGEFIRKWETSGNLMDFELDFLLPPWGQGLAVDDEDTVYVLSMLPPSVQKFTTNGEPIGEWGYFNFDEVLFPLPTAITTGSEGNVYIACALPGHIKKFTSEGEFLTKWNLKSPIGQFSIRPIPWRIAVDSGDNVYITLPLNNHIVQKYAKNGGNGPPCLSEKLYGEHSKKTGLLRDFRDNFLNKTPEGQEIIRLYYEWSPVIVKAMEEDEEFSKEVREMIDGILLMIKEEVE